MIVIVIAIVFVFVMMMMATMIMIVVIIVMIIASGGAAMCAHRQRTPSLSGAGAAPAIPAADKNLSNSILSYSKLQEFGAYGAARRRIRARDGG